MTHNSILCDTLWLQFRGVMFKKSFVPHIFPFKTCIERTFHSLFCKPLDIICLDENNKVLNIEYFPPFKIGVFKAQTIIETMPGALYNLKIGDVYSWKDSN